MPDQAQQSDAQSGLQKLMDQVAGSKGDAASWPVTIFLLAFFVLVLSVLGIKMALTKRAAAETARKLREELEKERQAQENAKLAANDAARKDAEQVIKDVQASITNLQNEMDARRVDHEEYVKELQGVSSWDQIVVVDARKPNG